MHIYEIPRTSAVKRVQYMMEHGIGPVVVKHLFDQTQLNSMKRNNPQDSALKVFYDIYEKMEKVKKSHQQYDPELYQSWQKRIEELYHIMSLNDSLKNDSLTAAEFYYFAKLEKKYLELRVDIYDYGCGDNDESIFPYIEGWICESESIIEKIQLLLKKEKSYLWLHENSNTSMPFCDIPSILDKELSMRAEHITEIKARLSYLKKQACQNAKEQAPKPESETTTFDMFNREITINTTTLLDYGQQGKKEKK